MRHYLADLAHEPPPDRISRDPVDLRLLVAERSARILVEVYPLTRHLPSRRKAAGQWLMPDTMRPSDVPPKQRYGDRP